MNISHPCMKILNIKSLVLWILITYKFKIAYWKKQPKDTKVYDNKKQTFSGSKKAGAGKISTIQQQ